jgi:Tfp pilus assembly protein PilF
MLQSQSLLPFQQSLDVVQWFTVLSDQASSMDVSTTATPTTAWKELYDYIISWEERASSSSTSALRSSTTTNILYSVKDWMEYMERIDDMITTVSTTAFVQRPSVSTPVTVVPKLSHDDNHNHNNHNVLLLSLLQQVRDWVGRRAVMYLPRSYQLWKSIWEFQIRVFVAAILSKSEPKSNASSTRTPTTTTTVASCHNVLQCFEQALLTLSNYPRVWIVYLQFLWQYPVAVTAVLLSSSQSSSFHQHNSDNKNNKNNNYHTLVRRVLNRALQSLPVTQHDKIWSLSGIIDDCFQQYPYRMNHNNNENDNNDDDDNNQNENQSETIQNEHKERILSFWPYPTMNRILCRYSQFLSCSGGTRIANTNAGSSSTTRNFPLEYATWCEKHEQYASAAAAYVAILNSYNNNNGSSSSHPTTTTTTTAAEGTATATTTADTIMVGTSNIHPTSPERDMVFQSLMELVAQHADTLQDGTAIQIPWETIVQTTIQNEIQLQQEQQQSKSNVPTQPVNDHHRFLGMLYTWYASAYIQRGEYDMARSIYEEGLLQVMTVRDFTILYTSYLSFLEGLIQVLYNNNNTDDDDDDDAHERNDSSNNDTDHENNNSEEKEDDDWDLLLLDQNSDPNKNSTSHTDDMEMAILRAEYLIQRRALLLNAVKLRQNPNDCAAYLERCELFLNPHHDHRSTHLNTKQPASEDEPQQVRPAITTLQEGLQRITNGGTSSNSNEKGSTKAETTISDLVLRLVQIYEETLHDIDAARNVYQSVCVQRTMALGIVSADELAICWTKYIEFELKHEQYDTALSLSRQSISSNPSSKRNQRNNNGTLPTTSTGSNSTATVRSLNLTKSLRLWDLLLDLEESLGTIQTTKDAYNRAIEIKAATVHHILNFASYLMEHQYYEESYTAYERGLELFAYPHPGAKLLWKAYIDSFIKRYKGTKVERVRNLFSRCLEHCPSSDCAEFFMIHGQYEEEHGLSKRALSVYKEMCEKVPVEDMYTAYQIFITKTIKHRGVIATRDIYQDAIEKLAKVHPKSVVKMCEDFAQMEVGLKQIDRARAIYVYGAQSADPRRAPEYWKGWNDFEIEYGNEDTFREMLRVKRSVEAAFSTINYNAIGMTQKVSNFTNEEAMSMIAAAEGMDYSDMNNVASTGTAVAGFVPATATSSSANKRTITTLDDVEERVAQLRKVTGVTESDNPIVPPPITIPPADQAYVDDDEIDLDEIDAEIAEAAADGANNV